MIRREVKIQTLQSPGEAKKKISNTSAGPHKMQFRNQHKSRKLNQK